MKTIPSHFSDKTSSAKKILAAVMLAILLAGIAPASAAPAKAQENLQWYEMAPPGTQSSRGRNLLSCLKGWMDFLVAGIGYANWFDYIRDFILPPLQQVDVLAVFNQTNRARYGVMSSFMRCDLTRLNSAVDAYYKAEAELYYLRHFAVVSGDRVRKLTDTPAQKDKMVQDMSDRVYPSQQTEEGRQGIETKMRAYFNEFETKYADRPRTYGDAGSDSIISQLADKWDEFVRTIKGLNSLGSEIAAAGRDVGRAGLEIGRAAVRAKEDWSKSPKKFIVDGLKAIGNKFEGCVETPGGRACAAAGGKVSNEGAFSGSEVEKLINMGKFIGNAIKSEPNSFAAIAEIAQYAAYKKTEDLDKAQMLARYELLYGHIAGGGTKQMVYKLDNLKTLLENGGKDKLDELGLTNLPGSIPALNKLYTCANEVLNRTCK